MFLVIFVGSLGIVHASYSLMCVFLSGLLPWGYGSLLKPEGFLVAAELHSQFSVF